MFSHIVIFWTDPAQPDAADELMAGAVRFLKPIPGVLQFHIGRMVGSSRPVVEQSYQVALNTQFASQAERETYRAHPAHKRFEEEILKKYCLRRLIYDFE